MQLAGCYAAAPATQSVVQCKTSVQTPSGGAWGACQGEVVPQPEQCNGLDNDYDGRPTRDATTPAQVEPADPAARPRRVEPVAPAAALAPAAGAQSRSPTSPVGQPKSGVLPSAVVDVANAKLLVVTYHDGPNSAPSLVRSDLDGLACTHTKLPVPPGLGGDTGYYGPSRPPVVIDAANATRRRRRRQDELQARRPPLRSRRLGVHDNNAPAASRGTR